MKLNKEQIKHISNLAKIDLSDSELDKFYNEFNSILDYVSQIDECDVSGIPEEHNLENFKSVVLQEDKAGISNSLNHSDIEKNATNGRFSNGYIVTKKKKLEE